VLDENKRLRRLLRTQGFSDADIDGSEHDENASSPSAAEILNVMLATPKVCRPSSTSACGDRRICKTEDNDDDDDDGDTDMDSRRQSNVSAAIPPAPVAARQQKQLRPIAVAPMPAQVSAPAVATVARPPQSLEARPLSQHFPQPQQRQSQPLVPQQQFYMSAPSHTSTPTASQHSVHASPAPFVQDYPIYAPQPFGYPVPQSQLLDWGMAAAEAMPQSGSYPPQGQYASPTQNYQPSYASPTTHTNTAAYSEQNNTTSCFTAAGVIRALHEEAGDEVESVLGCRADGNECRVDNTMVFDLMDRYASVQGQQGNM
jgi:hypothetical protein